MKLRRNRNREKRGPVMKFPDDPRALLGKDVRIKLADDVIAEGRLIAFDEGGQATLVDDMGFTHWCWPMLDIESAGE